MNFIETMDAQQQRRLAVGLLVAAVFALLGITVVPVVMANIAYNSDISDAYDRLQRLERLASQDEVLRSRYTQLRRAQANRGYFLEGDSEAVASADLQRILKDITTTNGTQLTSTQILPAVVEDSLTRVSLRVRVSGSVEGLIEMLHELESNSVLLFLDNVSLRTAATIRQRLKPTNRNPVFEANFDLTAYMMDTQ